MLVNNQFCSIKYMMKDVRVIQFHYIILEFLRNNYFIVIRYNINSTLVFMKRTFLIFCASKFCRQEIFFPSILVYNIKFNWKISFRKFFNVIQFRHSFRRVIGLLCRLLRSIVGQSLKGIWRYCFSPGMYDISGLYFSSISLHLNTMSELKNYR